ncbi:hypothetical protein YC2023_017728 [Brassica napus]
MNCDGETATAVFVLQRSTIPTRGDHGVVVRIKLSCGLNMNLEIGLCIPSNALKVRCCSPLRSHEH